MTTAPPCSSVPGRHPLVLNGLVTCTCNSAACAATLSYRMVSRLGYSADGRWERTDALAAFLKSTCLTPREARRTFGDTLPNLPPEAFAGRKIGPRGLSRWGPRIGRDVCAA
jgi:hypothetical protein